MTAPLKYSDLVRVLSELKTADLHDDYAKFADKIIPLRSSELGRRVIARLNRHARRIIRPIIPTTGSSASSYPDGLVFLLALQNDLLCEELNSWRQKLYPPPTRKELEARNETDPRRRRRMHREADAERERLYPLAHLRQKLESEEFLAAINKSGWKSNEGARGHQDDLPREPSLWKWCTHDLSMDIYHLMDATKVSRRTLLKFFCARGIKGHKKGRRTVYRAEEVRLAVREWLTNRHWHKKPEKQKEYLMHYLDGVACARSQDLPLELEFLEQATEQVISCDANFANWISDLNAEVVPHIKKPLLGLYDSLFGLDNYGSSENPGGNM